MSDTPGVRSTEGICHRHWDKQADA